MMNNFDYMTPTRLIFGKDVVNQLPEVMQAIGKRVLLAYGGGSIKRMGLYDKVKDPVIIPACWTACASARKRTLRSSWR